MAQHSLIDLVDQLMAARKTLSGVPAWTPLDRTGECRLKMPLLIDGQDSGAACEIDAYPDYGPLKYRVLLLLEKCVWRLDYDLEQAHTNPLDAPAGLNRRVIGPHYHSWSDNRRYGRPAALPDELLIVRPLDRLEIVGFDSVFRWFCGQTNIQQPENSAIFLPGRTRLL